MRASYINKEVKKVIFNLRASFLTAGRNLLDWVPRDPTQGLERGLMVSPG